MQSFTFRPAALRGDRGLRTGPEGLQHGDGPLRPWSELTGAAFAHSILRGVLMMHLDLSFGPETERVAYTGEGGGLEVYAPMIIAICNDIETARPDVEIELGYTGGARWGLFALGLAFAAIAALFLWLTVSGGASGPDQITFLVVAVITAVIGARLARANGPWSPARRVAPSALAAQMTVPAPVNLPDS